LITARAAQPVALPVSAEPAASDQSCRVVCESVLPSYDVCIVEDLLGSNSFYLARALCDCKSLVVTTPTVDRIFGARLRNALNSWELDAEVLVLPCTEASKSPETVLDVCRTAVDRGLGRNDVLVSFGGGVCSDVVTLSASLIRRGISHFRIPTTLTGQVDAGIGIKGGVNFCDKKNYLGCFYPPEEVLIDPTYLQSLARPQMSAGFAEIVKMAIICDRQLYDEIVAHGAQLMDTGFAAPRGPAWHIIWRSCELMLGELESNIYEDRTYERLVDFGHTFSPHLEALSEYRTPHGHAVALDMALSGAIARELGTLSMEEFESIVHLLHELELPVLSPLMTVEACHRSIQEAARHRGGRPNLVVPMGIGSAAFIRRTEDLTESLIRQALANLTAVVEAM
jgi:3-dehydroquinate synthase